MGKEAAGGNNSRVYTKLALCGLGVERHRRTERERGRASTRLLFASFKPSNNICHNKVLLAANAGMNADARVSAPSSNSAPKS